MQIKAQYFDGHKSAAHPAEITYQGHTQQVQLVWPDGELLLHLSELDINPSIGNVSGTILLPEGGQLVINDAAALDQFIKTTRIKRPRHWLHRLESSTLYSLFATVLSVISIWFFLQYGVPWMAEKVVNAIPPSAERRMGEQTLKALDRTVFSPSKLSIEKQQALSQYLLSYLDQGQYRIEFRYSKRIGANAFALPSGTIIITDDLVNIAKNDLEIASVFFHEVGHQVKRHSLRNLLQSSTSILLISFITGDLASTTSLAAALPTVLLQSKFSREFELEADEYARQQMQRHHISLDHFEAILMRLHESNPAERSEFDLFSSHPALNKRLQKLNHLNHD